MTTYNNVFGNLTVPPSEYQYQALALTANSTFYWPSQYSGTGYILAKINSIAATTGAYTLTLPQASVVSTGMDALFINSTGSTITINDYSGGAVTTISAGVAKYIYVADNSTDAGVWGTVTYGNTTALVDASALAGYGTKATGSTLSVDSPVTETALTITVNATTGRGQSYVFTGGSVPCTFPSALSAGSGFFFYVKNGGTGTVTLTPVGGDTVDLQSTLGLNPDESCLVISTGVDWHTIGLGRSTIYQFTKLVKDLTGISSYTLTSSDASNKLLQFTGAPSAATTITVPAVVSIYYVQISTSNAYTVTLKTAAGTGVTLAQTSNSILYCDGVNVVAAQTASAPASATAITNDTTTNATMYPVWVTAATGNLPLYVSSTKYSFNPSTGVITATGLALTTMLSPAYGGTGINNGTYTITLGGPIVTAKDVTVVGAYTLTATLTNTTAVTFPVSGNLLSSVTAVAAVTGTPSSSNYLRGDGTWSTLPAVVPPSYSNIEAANNFGGLFS